MIEAVVSYYKHWFDLGKLVSWRPLSIELRLAQGQGRPVAQTLSANIRLAHGPRGPV